MEGRGEMRRKDEGRGWREERGGRKTAQEGPENGHTRATRGLHEGHKRAPRGGTLCVTGGGCGNT
eukprot:5370708-Pyramimonas_sp.AAC.1